MTSVPYDPEVAMLAAAKVTASMLRQDPHATDEDVAALLTMLRGIADEVVKGLQPALEAKVAKEREALRAEILDAFSAHTMQIDNVENVGSPVEPGLRLAAALVKAAGREAS